MRPDLTVLPPRFLRTKEAAEFLSLSARTLEKHRTYGTGPAYRKLGGRVVYPSERAAAFPPLLAARTHHRRGRRPSRWSLPPEDVGAALHAPASRRTERLSRQALWPIAQANQLLPMPVGPMMAKFSCREIHSPASSVSKSRRSRLRRVR